MGGESRSRRDRSVDGLAGLVEGIDETANGLDRSLDVLTDAERVIAGPDVTLASGLAGRQELSIEIAAPGTDPGLGRRFLSWARTMFEPGSWLFAAVSPGNARSLRSFLATGFVPIGSEVIIDRSGVDAPGPVDVDDQR